MQVSVENTSTLGRRLKVSVPDAVIQEQISAKMNELSKQAHLKGFRPGKVPKKVLEQKFGKAVRSEVIHELIKKSLGEAVEEQHLQPAGMPKIEKIEEGEQNLEFVATFDIFPEITLKSLQDVEIEKRLVTISDEDVKKMISKLQDQLAPYESVNRSIKNEDKITVDFSRLLKDKSDKESQQNVEMVVGVKGVVPGLSEALVGKNKGDVVEINTRYPEDWAENSVAGIDVTLWVTVHDVKEKKAISELELAQKLQIEGDSLDKMQQTIRERMQQELDETLKDELKEKVLEKFLDLNPIELPQSLIEQEKEAIINEISRQRRGAHLSAAEKESDEINDSAKRRVELGLLLNEVIKVNNLKVDPNLVRVEIDKLASRFPNADKIAELYYKNNELLSNVERIVLLEQAVHSLLKEAKLVEKNASFEEVMNASEEA
jgi:trigger factor